LGNVLQGDLGRSIARQQDAAPMVTDALTNTLILTGAAFAIAVVGGLLLGYGARLAYGCNIGAYFSGIVSGSLHGWLWLVAAFAGNVFGTRLRPLFGLEVERVKPSGC
jgi:ABC-type dipeptide/oligopeptide/nickel transport system permease component